MTTTNAPTFRVGQTIKLHGPGMWWHEKTGKLTGTGLTDDILGPKWWVEVEGQSYQWLESSLRPLEAEEIRKYRVEFCAPGGSFGVAHVEAASADEAVRKMNATGHVHFGEHRLTRATLA